jgi:CheY-like chemotaxis protein
MNGTVLLVEDERELRATLREALGVEGWRVHAAASLADARALLANALRDAPPDAVLLDLGLPDGDGESLLATLRREQGTPVIVISARDAESGKIRLLDAGADDYLVKPFSIGELLARLRVALRHRGRAVAAAVTRYVRGGLVVDIAAHRVMLDGAPDAHRIRAARAPGAPGRPGGDASPAARRCVGDRVHRAHALPAPVHGPAARQARGRPGRAAAPAYGTGRGVPHRRTRLRRRRASICVPDAPAGTLAP